MSESGYKDTLVTRVVNIDNKPEGLVILRTFTHNQEPPKYRVELGGDSVFYFEDGTVIDREKCLGKCSECKKRTKTRTYECENESHCNYYTYKTELCDSCFIDNLFRYTRKVNDYELIKQ